MTLAFLGDLQAGQLHRLRPGLAEVSQATPPFDLAVAGSGVFPGERRPRVLWVGLSGELEVLTGLAAGVRRAARRARIELDRKPFQPHMTVARVRRGLPEHDLPHLLRKLSVADGRGWQVDRLVLMQSTLGPQPRYEEIAAWPLTGLI